VLVLRHRFVGDVLLLRHRFVGDVLLLLLLCRVFLFFLGRHRHVGQVFSSKNSGKNLFLAAPLTFVSLATGGGWIWIYYWIYWIRHAF